ncbi:DUF922 domain-containing protein [Aegicerativicinus sediminis]
MLFFRIILGLTFLLCSVNKDRVIPWKPSQKLTWADFQGEQDVQSKAAAVTSSGITFSYSLKRNNNKITGFNVIVEAHFYPDYSWYNKDVATNHILSHEQLHFDITELHVRKLRQGISKLPISQDVKNQLDALHQLSKQEMQEMQLLYDKQSKNSTNREMQLYWNNFISERLYELERFASPN